MFRVLYWIPFSSGLRAFTILNNRNGISLSIFNFYRSGCAFHLPKEVFSKSSQRFSYTPFFASMFSSRSGGIYIDIYTTAFPLSFLFCHHRGHDLMFSLNLITSCKRPLRDNHSGNFRHLWVVDGMAMWSCIHANPSFRLKEALI